ncbi:22553_t:CDS:1, partial [Racocetra persica]
CKQKIAQLKEKSIDNYPKMKKVALLGLTNHDLGENITARLENLLIINGSIKKSKTSIRSRVVTEMHIQLIEVIVLNDLTDDDYLLANYSNDGLIEEISMNDN